MTDEQTPGQPPQDPGQTPDQPIPGQTPGAAPPPPVNPYEQQPSAPEPTAPTYGQPTGQPSPPPYGDPAATPPAYGQPAPPAYGQATPPPYGQPGMQAGMPPGMQAGGFPPAEPQPSKAMAITALVTSLLCCTPVGFILAVVVLVRSKDGRNHGRGLAIAALIISILFSVGIAVGAYGLTKVDWDEFLPVEQLKTGECLDADNLTDDSEDFVENIEEVDCDEPHDAEVLVTKELTQDDAESYDPASSTLCSDLITEKGLAAKIGDGIGFFGLTTDEAPNAGDKLVCIAYKLDGSKLDAPL